MTSANYRCNLFCVYNRRGREGWRKKRVIVIDWDGWGAGAFSKKGQICVKTKAVVERCCGRRCAWRTKGPLKNEVARSAANAVESAAWSDLWVSVFFLVFSRGYRLWRYPISQDMAQCQGVQSVDNNKDLKLRIFWGSNETLLPTKLTFLMYWYLLLANCKS